LCMILAGTTSIFDTDLYQSIIRALPKPVEASPLAQAEQDVHRRIIADHARATVFLAADGLTPSNTDRGYVMRFLMRRALRSGRSLRLPDGFLGGLVGAVTDSLADAYPQLRSAQAATKATFADEERLFDRTLARGESRLDAIVADAKRKGTSVIAGRDIFELHDTYGFPAELTAEIVRENGLEADMVGYRTAMEEQRERARRDAQEKRTAVRVEESPNVDLPDSTFIGYDSLTASANVVALFDRTGKSVPVLEQGESGIVLLDRTPFYAERGGQAGDRGAIAREGAEFLVTDTQYQDKTYQRIMHHGTMSSGSLRQGDRVDAFVDAKWRREIRRHHSVTHLMQRALKEALGDAVAQRGSAVYPDHTRFDFDSPRGALTKEQERQVEARINELIRADYHISVAVMPFAEAVARGAIYMKGENYGDIVRVVTFGPSVELCGGTHVESTGEIGHFVLTSEGAIAAGVRRVEGMVSEAADRYVMQVRDAVEQAGSALGSSVDKLGDSAAHLSQKYRDLEKLLAGLQAQIAGERAAQYLTDVKEVDGVPYLAVRAENAAGVRTLSDAIRSRWPKGLLAIAGGDDNKVSVLVTASEDIVAHGISAHDILAKMMSFVSGRGGGTAQVAQGGGKNAAGIDAALAAVPDAIRAARG
jgi:alanyl-tRNA synthetase